MNHLTLTSIFKGAKIILRSIFCKQRTYTLTFVHEADTKWYVDFPNWPFDHYNLMMVSGADKLCAFLSDDDERVTISVMPSQQPLNLVGYAELKRTAHGLTKGAFYDVLNLEGFRRDIWLCPVTLFVLGRYPHYLYIKKVQ